jgi:hypothetical protein
VFAAFLLSLLAGGCGSPSEPYERKPPVPEPVSDLAVAQSGNQIVLTFTLPASALDHRPLERPLAVDIYRDFRPLAAAGGAAVTIPTSPTLLATIPSAMIDQYANQGRVRYADSLRREDFETYPDTAAVYTVRTFVSPNKPSPDSNAADVPIYRVPDPIADLKAEVTQSAVVLEWTPPERSPIGGAQLSSYRVYRLATEPGAATPAVKTAGSLTLIGESDSATPSLSDSNFEFGKTYTYVVRSVLPTPNGPLESNDSNPAVVTPKDTFPPSAPQGPVVSFVPAQPGTPAHLELSWAISPETDIAGYSLYRSEQAGVSGTRLNTELLLAPAFRDMNVLPGRRYFYTVIAVDHAGNESAPSRAVSGGVPTESQPTP